MRGWVGWWGGYECSRNARSIPGKNIHSSMALLTALLTHGICFFFTYFSFYYQCLEKIIFILTVSLCKFAVINATQISKFEREMQQQLQSSNTPTIFSFPLYFPPQTLRRIVFQFTAYVIAICTAMNKNRNSKLESGAMETHFDPKDFFSFLS